MWLSFSRMVAPKVRAGGSENSGIIRRIERGERNASLELALRLSAYLDMPVEELFTIEDE